TLLLTALPSPPVLLLFFFILRRPPSSTLFPYTTLFRSRTGARPSSSPWGPTRGGAVRRRVPPRRQSRPRRLAHLLRGVVVVPGDPRGRVPPGRLRSWGTDGRRRDAHADRGRPAGGPRPGPRARGVAGHDARRGGGARGRPRGGGVDSVPLRQRARAGDEHDLRGRRGAPHLGAQARRGPAHGAAGRLCGDRRPGVGVHRADRGDRGRVDRPGGDRAGGVESGQV